MKVLKFGGSSVESPERVRAALDIVAREAAARIVVVSAFGGVTDTLDRLATEAASGSSEWRETFEVLRERHRTALTTLAPVDLQAASAMESLLGELEEVAHGVSLVRERTRRTGDFILGFGERLSATIVAAAAVASGLEAVPVDAREFIVTDGSFGRARVDYSATRARLDSWPQARRTIVTGFIAATPTGESTTLGRGGSDFTAAILASLMGAEAIEIWTDVPGILSADPRQVADAYPLGHVTYDEAMELSHFGAKVLHPPTLQPARDAGIPLRVASTLEPSAPGTWVLETMPDSTERAEVTGLSSIPNVSLVELGGSGLVGVAGSAQRLFGAIARHEISAILIAQASSEHSICIAVRPDDAEAARRALEQEFALELEAHLVDPICVESALSVISVVGSSMRRTPGIAGKVFRALGRNNLNVIAIAQGASELAICFVVRGTQERRALQVIHDEFLTGGVVPVNVVLFGCGLIGTELIAQIEATRASLLHQYGFDIRLAGLANSRGIVLDSAGLGETPRARLEAEGEAWSSADELFARIRATGLSGPMLVDVTASDAVPALYVPALRRGMPVVAANKRAQTGSQAEYDALREAARSRRAGLFYETAVGAGLPVLSTLEGLLASGDEIRSIEATLSGSLGFIFASFSEGGRFSEWVREARERGFTEPDPREDLEGLDVARKLLILMRDAGFTAEPEDIEVEPAVPREWLSLDRSVEEFLEDLAAFDAEFEVRRDGARAQGRRWVYLARFDGQMASAGLATVSDESPFHGLRGSENMIVFRTRRYDEAPLVVRGPGAGAAVTAAGVLGDIVLATQTLR